MSTDEKTGPGLTHLDAEGRARMVNVGEKAITHRVCVARCEVQMEVETLDLITSGRIPKGDVLATARVAGIQAAKKTSELIPLCHPLPLSRVAIDLTLTENGVAATATAATDGRTGVEMEALTAASVALLTIYDMAKAVDKGMVIEDIRLLSKRGGKSGDWTAA